MSHYLSNGADDGERRPLLSSSDWPDSGDHSMSRPELQHENCDDRENVEKRLLRKVDRRMSLLVLIYILNYIDRSSVAATRLRGFEEDLGLSGSQFASILSAFYLGYIPMQIPSNMLLSQITAPSFYLSLATILWGSVSLLTGMATDYHQALFARVSLGLVEAAFLPGALFYLSKWYKRSELSERMAFLIGGNLLSMAFGALVASAILDMMDGVLGLTAWRWLFFVEGGITVSIGYAALFVLPDFPESKIIPWLSPLEHVLAQQRMIEDAADASLANGDATSGFKLAVTDWKVWYLALTLFFIVVASSFQIYFPTLAATIGYNPTVSLLLCVPPWLFAAGWSVWLCRRSDKLEERCMHIVIPSLIAMAGFLTSTLVMNKGLRYFSIGMIFYAWASSTISIPPSKRAVGLALINSVSQSGNIVGSYIWLEEWGPSYAKSYAICSVAYFICIVMCLWLSFVLKRLNSEMDLDETTDWAGAGSTTKGWRYHT